MATEHQLPLFRVYDDPESLRAVANTIIFSFAQDPLIQWLRPLADLWSVTDPNTSKWQYRRVQRAVADGIVVRSAAVGEIYKNGDVYEHDAGAVALFFPPRGRVRGTLGRMLLSWKLWFLGIVSPIHEKGGNEQRLQKLMDTHDRVIKDVQQKYGIPDLWYLEVIAVHPRLQGRGLGRKALCSVLAHTNNEPVILECTNWDNVAFYERLGFKVVEEVELIEGDAAVKLWFMLRQGSETQAN
ncbi:GNAT family N-acetyltransferase [Aspergillus puulaauensis]|uniref:N-acetyltransferase domain-containing protein n=1 Tax=Aspergillus puulaauensis TaxID=1220207 RepID=A0A7R8ASK2_9EURO|nr:uncharacterized protein APUU_60868A [Aspergillus puulaauensis]BCS27820.1 hypothetical protein APUU_60868A [Aspergillus puulaauensis]